MVVGVRKRAVGIFSHRRDAEDALHEMKNSGFAMDRVSVIAQDTDRDNIAGAEVHEKVGNKADEGASLGAVSGGTLGGLTGLLVGLGTLAIPGIGPVMLAGAAATAIATTLAGAGIGAAAGSLLGGLIGLGIPEEEARSYNSRVERGHYLVIVDGSDAEISAAEAIMRRRGIEDFAIYNQPADPTSRDYNALDVPPVGLAPVGFVNPALDTPGVFPTPITPIGGTTHQRKRAIGVFARRNDAEAAVSELRNSGFASDDVSIIGKDTGNNANANVAGTTQGNKADEGAKAGATTGAALGGVGGLLVGLGALAIPGVGPVLLGGAAATALATAITGAGIGAAAGGVTGGLVGLGIPENQAQKYSDRLNRGDYLVIVDGTDDEIRRAEAILKRHGIQDYDTYDATDVSSHRRENAPLGVGNPGVGTSGIGSTATTHQRRRAIGVFAHRNDAEAAVSELRNSSFAADDVSIIGKDAGNASANVAGTTQGNKADDGAKAGAATGAALGGLGGLLVGLGALAIPGVGPVLLGGAAATALATAATGAGIGAAAGGVTGGLVGLGIPENQAQKYSDRLNRGDYLVIVDGTDDEIRRAETILKRHGIQDFDTYDATDISSHRRETPLMDAPRTNYAADINSEASVVIIDRRDETV